MNLGDYRKWLAIGTGVGIEVGDRDLRVIIARARPSGPRLVAEKVIERFRERYASEWGVEYAAFLKQNGGAHLAATVLLPRRDLIVRQLALPGVSGRELEQAVRFQLDGLHPFSEDEALFGWAPLGDTGNVLIAITRREVVDKYAALFDEAGIKVMSFTCSAAVVYSAVRMFSPPPAGGFLALQRNQDEFEAYGESPSRAVFSATFEASSEIGIQRSLSMAVAELRLPPETEPVAMEVALPPQKDAPEQLDQSAAALPWAAALAAACPRLSARVNLLPVERRAASSRGMYIPAIVLGSLLLLGSIGLAIYSSYEDRQYLKALQAEIHKLEPDARRPLLMDRAIETARKNTKLLDDFRRRTKADMDTFLELTRLVNAPAWTSAVEITRDSIRISGEAEKAAGLLKQLDQSPLFEGSEFTMPMSRTTLGEAFAIHSRREGVLP